jgi:hypothetical protein
MLCDPLNGWLGSQIDEALDKLMILCAWTARRLVN